MMLPTEIIATIGAKAKPVSDGLRPISVWNSSGP